MINLKNKKAILTVGLTHSGKTTFAHLLEESLENTFVVDTDKIALFLKKDFPRLFYSKANSYNLDKPNIKLNTFLNLLKWGINSGLNPILSNGNHMLVLRNFLIDFLKGQGYKVGIVYFNFSVDFLKKRIKDSNKSTDIFSVSKSFDEVLEKQLLDFVKPVSDEVGIFFEIKSESDFHSTLESVKNWLSIEN